MVEKIKVMKTWLIKVSHRQTQPVLDHSSSRHGGGTPGPAHKTVTRIE